LCFFFGQAIKGNTRGKKKHKGVIGATQHSLNNNWRSALEAKVESTDSKMESISNSLLHIKELLLKNVDNGTKDTPLPMQRFARHWIECN
jgi:hypothetical protein